MIVCPEDEGDIPLIPKFTILNESSRYVTVTDITQRYVFDQAEANAKIIGLMLSEYRNRLQSIANSLPSAKSFESFHTKDRKITPMINYMLDKFSKLQVKRRECDRGICEEIIEDLEPPMRLIEVLLKKNVPVTVDMQGLCALQDCKFRLNDRLKKLNHNILSLEKALVRNGQAKTGVDVSALKNGLIEARMQCQERLDYCPVTDFDDMLAEFVPRKKVLEIAREISSESGFTLMIAQYGSLCSDLGAETKAEKIVIRNALSRVVFDEVYLMSSLLDVQSTEITLNVQMIKKMTPNDLKLLPELFPNELWTTPLEQIMSSLPLFDTGFLLLDCLMFLIDPLEIAQNLWQLTVFVKQWLSPDGTKREMKSFEEYFSAFFTLFVGHPPINAKGIALFLKLCSPISGSPVFSHSTMTYMGTVDYIEKFVEENHSPVVMDKIQQL